MFSVNRIYISYFCSSYVKIPFTNRQGNPDCTKFLAGRIERIQQRTKTAKILILGINSCILFIPVTQY